MTTAATPSPSVALVSLLAAPPSGYVQDTEFSGTPIGEFDAGAYLTFLGPDDPNATAAVLQRDGFVRGYGESWTDGSTGRGLALLVIAFEGGRGAREWLETTATMAHEDRYYEGGIAVTGIDPYLGVHYADPSTSNYADVVSFVKGNDYFLVGFVSKTADLGDTAAVQSKRQYDFAVAASIPPSEWPENSGSAGWYVQAAAMTFGAGIMLLLVAALAFLVLRSRRRLVAAPTMSPDGFYWWDGRAWRDAWREAPPAAARSGDGKLWWDGHSWRPVPPAG